MNYTDLLKSISVDTDGTLSFIVPETWMQGRTTYGGLTAAVSLKAALTLVDDLPLRSVQVAFVGPVSGRVTIRPRLLRRGKNTAFICVDVYVGEAVMAQSIFVFGARRESQLSASFLQAPTCASYADSPDFFTSDMRPNFTRNFDVRRAFGGTFFADEPDRTLGLWLKFKDEDTPQDAVSMLALADCPPPAAMMLFGAPAPISTSSWMVEFLTDMPRSASAWWLSSSAVDSVADGYAHQSMNIWNDQGQPIMIGRQTVAVFA